MDWTQTFTIITTIVTSTAGLLGCLWYALRDDINRVEIRLKDDINSVEHRLKDNINSVEHRLKDDIEHIRQETRESARKYDLELRESRQLWMKILHKLQGGKKSREGAKTC